MTLPTENWLKVNYGTLTTWKVQREKFLVCCAVPSDDGNVHVHHHLHVPLHLLVTQQCSWVFNVPSLIYLEPRRNSHWCLSLGQGLRFLARWKVAIFRFPRKRWGKGKTKWKVPPKHDLLNGACNLGLACCLANYTFQAAATVNSRVILFVYLCKNSAPLSLGQRQSHNAHFCVCAGGGVGSFVNAREVRCIPIVQSHGHEVQTAAVLPLNTEKQHSLDWAISSTEGGGVIMSDWNSSPTTSFTTPAGRVAF